MRDREIGVEAARKQLGPLVDDAAVDGVVTYLTRRGRRFAAIVPLDRIKDTGPGGGQADVVSAAGLDRDAVFEAVEELVAGLDAAAGLGPDVDRAAAVLADRWAGQSGDGPIEDLVAAALAVVEAVTEHPGPIPARLSATCATTRFALTVREENR